MKQLLSMLLLHVAFLPTREGKEDNQGKVNDGF